MRAGTCVITGASRGIGLATALRFARAGCNVVIAARTSTALEKAAAQIVGLGVGCEALPVDVSRPETAAELIEVAQRRFGRIDVLVNNAGLAVCKPTEAISNEDFDNLLRVNIAAVFYASRAVLPGMGKQGGGVIVSLSSMASADPFPGLGAYGACKAWVNLFTRALADEGKPHGIRAFAVAPGAVETDMLRGSFPDYPVEQCLQPDDVARVIEQLCDESMRVASGQTIFVSK
jgi:NAD(P)-dependent dehydrogenase (short-subunit alcohol dehydrogenase family)